MTVRGGHMPSALFDSIYLIYIRQVTLCAV
nr:hypothetical protein JQWJAGXB_JQWJAGXB_CDS_0006 [Microvirus sp.]